MLFVLHNLLLRSLRHTLFFGGLFFEQSHWFDFFTRVRKFFVSGPYLFWVKFLSQSEVCWVVEGSRGQCIEYFIGVENVWLFFGILCVHYSEPNFLLLLKRLFLIFNKLQSWIYFSFQCLLSPVQWWLEFNIHERVVTFILLFDKSSVEGWMEATNTDAWRKFTQCAFFKLLTFVVSDLFPQLVIISLIE